MERLSFLLWWFMTTEITRKVAALTIAGSDSGGNAGIQADLRAFNFFGVHGCTAITALTAQNPFQVYAVLSADAEFMTQQIDAVIDTYDIRALKTGMLCTAEIIQAVAESLVLRNRIAKVIDPVMVATSGAKLLEDDAVEMLCRELLPCADLITPNLPEAAVLLDKELVNESAIVNGARELHDRLGCAILIKGGHANHDNARDLLYDGENAYWFSTPRINDALSTHGTGCSLSAAIAASLACGNELIEAVTEGKAFVYEAIRTAIGVGECAAVLGTPCILPKDQVTINEIKL